MTGNDNFCLSLTDFDENIKILWQKSQMEYDFCDVTLSCEDKQIKTHKLIISSFSPIFVTKEDLPSFLEVAEDLSIRCLCEKNREGEK